VKFEKTIEEKDSEYVDRFGCARIRSSGTTEGQDSDEFGGTRPSWTIGELDPGILGGMKVVLPQMIKI